ncbi:unnamed protein product [Protopolystoma xenopodis]|uniref:Uncharacterized protein n=1 Tax=Protopolystoma xenopodis TaxID=117903 RepID=A0A448WN55_9PLAT|nr:unnamed protein product [Protopolystoma xenopodis]
MDLILCLTTLKRTTAPTARPASPISHEASVGETGANSRCKPPGPASPMSSTSSLSASQSTSATSGIAANMSASPSSFVPSTNPIGSLLPTAGLTAGVAGIGSGSGALGNPKRAYEAWLMELRVRTYLANLRVVREPPILTEMSLRVEPNKVAGRERRAAERAAKERIKEREREREKEKERAREEKKKEKEKETESMFSLIPILYISQSTHYPSSPLVLLLLLL